jgi:Ring finger domain
MPALFGTFMLQGQTYRVRIQYLRDNPYLCENTTQYFVPPSSGLEEAGGARDSKPTLPKSDDDALHNDDDIYEDRFDMHHWNDPPPNGTSLDIEAVVDAAMSELGGKNVSNQTKPPHGRRMDEVMDPLLNGTALQEFGVEEDPDDVEDDYERLHQDEGNMDDESSLVLMHEAIAILAARGECPFQHKAKMAENLHPSVQFLIVYNYNLHQDEHYHFNETDSQQQPADEEIMDEEELFPMYSEFGNTRLILLSITHFGGQEIKAYIADQDAATLALGGPVVYINADPPPGVMSEEDLQNALISMLGFFLMMISTSSCLLICAGTVAYVDDQGRLVLASRQQQQQPLESATPGETAAGTPVIITTPGRRLLTEPQVRAIHQHVMAAAQEQPATSPDAASSPAAALAGVPPPHDPGCCAICIDDFTSESDVITLPCQHGFHAHCIVPWLSERQARCPLCKYDVWDYGATHEMMETSPAATASAAAGSPVTQSVVTAFNRVSTRLLRSRWLPVLHHDDDDDTRRRDGIMIVSPQEMDNEDSILSPPRRMRHGHARLPDHDVEMTNQYGRNDEVDEDLVLGRI